MQRRARAAWVVVFIIATTAGAVPATASAANASPECHGSVFTVEPGGSRALPLTCTDVDHQPRVLSYDKVGDPDGGSLGEVNHTTSTVRFTADPGFSGTTTVAFGATDGSGEWAFAEHEIRVTSEQQRPVCDTAAVQAIDGYATFTPCSDPDAGDAVSVEVLDPPPAHGTATVYGATVSYTAGPFRGLDAITVRASDGTRTTDPTTIPIEVTDATAPECEPRGTIPVRPDRVKRLGLRCWDNLPRWNPWSSFEEIEPPLRGTFRSSWDGGWSYDPDPGFTSGTDRAVIRPIGSTTRAGAPIELNFTIGADANEPPECITWPARPVRPGRETIAVACSDPDDDPLTLTLTDPPEKGTFTAASEAGGFGTYVPDAGTSGADDLTVVAGDGREESQPVVQHLEIVPGGENHAPVCVGQAHHAVQGFEAFVSATCLGDEENDPFTTALGAPGHGALTDLGAGLWSYVSAPDFVGADDFTMTADDGTAAPTPTAVRMHVRAPVAPQCPQRPPRTVRTAVFTYLDLTCIDDAGSPVPVVTDPPDHGSIVHANDGWFAYQSEPGYEGPDAFTVTATNDHGAVPRTQELTVDEDFNTAPECSVDPEAYTRQVAVDLTAECFDAESDEATLAISDAPDHGTISGLDPVEGALTYTPHPDFVGRDSFAVVGTDTRGGVSQPAVQKIVVRDADRNLAPDCTAAEHWVEKGMSAPVSDFCSDADGDPITLTIARRPEHGSVTLAPDGWPVYAAPSNFTGVETFAVTASDGTLTSDAVTITMNVTGERGTPTCSPIAFTATAGVARSVDLACAPWGGGGPGMTIEIVGRPGHGTLGPVGADRKVTYTAASGYVGADTFTYRAREGDQVSATVSATITVVKPVAATQPTQPAQPAPSQPAPTGTTPTTPLAPLPGLIRPVAPLPGTPAAAPSLSVQELAARALGVSARLARGLKLGRIRAYIPTGRAAVRGRATPLLALICPTSSCTAAVRPRLELGRRRTTLRTQRLRFGAGSPGAAVLRLSASQLRAFKRARRGTVRFMLTAGRRRGTVAVPVAAAR